MIGSGFGILALVPAMLNLTVLTGGDVVAVQICTGDGQVHTMQLPLGGEGQGKQNGLCCAKGCHNGNSRKRTAGKFEPAQ